MSELIAIREAARRLGVSDTAVRKAIAAGRVSVAGNNEKNGRPELSWPQCRDQWVANSDASKRSHVGGTGQSKERKKYDKGDAQVALPVSGTGAGPGSRVGSGPAVPATSPAPSSPPPQPPPAAASDDGADLGRSASGGPSYAASRAVREAYAARLARLEYEERSGKLVSVDVVRVEAFKAHRRVRDAVLNIPDRCAPQLASMTDPAEVHAYLLGEIVEALRMLSADIYRPGVSA